MAINKRLQKSSFKRQQTRPSGRQLIGPIQAGLTESLCGKPRLESRLQPVGRKDRLKAGLQTHRAPSMALFHTHSEVPKRASHFPAPVSSSVKYDHLNRYLPRFGAESNDFINEFWLARGLACQAGPAKGGTTRGDRPTTGRQPFDQSRSPASAARIAEPNSVAFFAPTPLMHANCSSVAGQARAMRRKAESCRMKKAGTPCRAAKRSLT
jgi:hypothetical protein